MTTQRVLLSPSRSCLRLFSRRRPRRGPGGAAAARSSPSPTPGSSRSSGAEIPKGTIVIKDGVIAAIGADVAVPAGAEVVDAAGLRAYPGMIDGYSSLGLVEISGVAATVDNRETGRINPQARALEAVRYDSMHIPIARSNGITAAVVAPSGGVISGVSCLLRLDGWTNREMAVKPAAAMQIELPGLRSRARGGFGGGRGAAQVRVDAPALLAELKELFARGAGLRKAEGRGGEGQPLAPARIRRDVRGPSPPAQGRDAGHDISVHSERDIRRPSSSSRTRGSRPSSTASSRASRPPTSWPRPGIPVVIGSLYDMPPVWEDGYDALFRNPGLMAKAGVKIAFSSSSASAPRTCPTTRPKRPPSAWTRPRPSRP